MGSIHIGKLQINTNGYNISHTIATDDVLAAPAITYHVERRVFLDGNRTIVFLAGNPLRNQIGLKPLTIYLGFPRVESAAKNDYSLEAS